MSAIAAAPLLKVAEPIADSYIVKIKDGFQPSQVQTLALGYNAKHVYDTVYNGFSAVLSAEQVEALRANAMVEYIEEDGVMHALYETQNNPTWGLDRVDQANLPLDSEYKYDSDAGEGVDVYIIDTGVRNSHNEFGGRSNNGYDFHNGNGQSDDDNGHGTHVAGTTSGSTYGMAKKSTVYGVKVLGAFGSGSTANVVAGVDYTARECDQKERCVGNMSLGGGASSAMDNAVTGAVRDGVHMVLASGNSNANACNSSPARVGGTNGDAITVNAADSRDNRASFSNYGTCTDIFAPGVSITSAWHTSNSATNTISGTSMASPHVAGAVACQLADNNRSPNAMKREIAQDGTPNVISNPGSGSPNINLFSAYQ